MTDDVKITLDFHSHSDAAERSSAARWRGVSVEHSRIRLPAEYEFRWDGHSHYLAYHDIVLLDGAMEVGNDRPIPGGDLRDTMTYVPKGCEITGWARPASRINSFTVVYFDPSVLESELETPIIANAARPSIYFADTNLACSMRKLARAMDEDAATNNRLFAEALGLAAALEILAKSVPVETGKPPLGTLSRHQAKIVHDYIEEHLAQDISLDQLAALSGLTRFHFSRSFKATFGSPPYQYVIMRRLEKAKELLARTGMEIDSVATTVGFHSLAQFKRAFQANTGITPRQFRRKAL